MKILILASGRSYHATRWANSLAKLGLEVVFVTQHSLVRPLHESIKVYHLPIRKKIGYLLNFLFLKKIIIVEHPAIVHAHYAAGYGLLGALSAAKVLLISVYGSDIYEFPHKSPLHRMLLKWILGRARQVFSTSENMKSEICATYQQLTPPLVIPFGVDIELFKPLDAIRSLNQHPFQVGVVKKLEKIYGIDILILAVQWFICNISSEITLTIVGEGDERLSLEELVLHLNLEKHVKFLGSVPNATVPEHLTKFDVFVVPSRRESFGVAAVEALACGLPTIVSDVGGLPEVVENNKSGLVFEAENYVQLGERLAELYLSPELRTRLSKGARDKVLSSYNWAINVDSLHKFYIEFERK